MQSLRVPTVHGPADPLAEQKGVLGMPVTDCLIEQTRPWDKLFLRHFLLDVGRETRGQARRPHAIHSELYPFLKTGVAVITGFNVQAYRSEK